MGQGHDHGTSMTGRRLLFSVIITVAFVIGEAAAGYFSNSLALLSDAGHNFADALALVLSFYGLWIAQRPSSAKRTFGYHRVGILVALVNAVSLVVIALIIFWEAASRLRHPEPVQSTPMIVVALIAILLNTVISLWLRSAAKTDLNIRSWSARRWRGRRFYRSLNRRSGGLHIDRYLDSMEFLGNFERVRQRVVRRRSGRNGNGEGRTARDRAPCAPAKGTSAIR